MENYRVERDSMGEVKVPKDFYFGAQTTRAIDNFKISDLKIPKPFLNSLAIIKLAAAKSNFELNLLDKKKCDIIEKVCLEILNNQFDNNFPIDVYQTGSGTSWNMNINEVIANRANELLGGKVGDKSPIHPNDHINLGQSSNDAIPTAINISSYLETIVLVEKLENLYKTLLKKERQFLKIYKIGRTHLQDAVPMTLGQEFSGWKQQIKNASNLIKTVMAGLLELAIGGTAIGTGINTDKKFGELTVKNISKFLKIDFKVAKNYFEAIACRDSVVALSGAFNTLAVALMKIANDIRLLSSGPRCGFNEITLKSLQPGSSIMPGKINPVVPEAVVQVAASIMGKNLTITVAGQNGPLQLNIMQPLIAYEILEMAKILTNCVIEFDKCIFEIEANRENCENIIEKSLALVTPLACKIGYDKAAEIAYSAFSQNITVREAAKKLVGLSDSEINEIFDIKKMV